MKKKYELAKKQGLNWQVVLISDAETELKVLIRDLVLFGAALSIVNTKITQKIKETVDALDSEVLKDQINTELKNAEEVVVEAEGHFLKENNFTVADKYLKSKIEALYPSYFK